MDFSFSDIQRDVQALAHKVLHDQSTTQRLNEVDEQAERFDKKLWAQLAQLGLLGVAFSEKHGGMGLGFMELCLLAEEVGRTVAAAPIVPVIVSAGLPIKEFGTAEQQSRLLAPLICGDLLLTAALNEAQNECPSSPATVARASGSSFTLTGTKICVPFAQQSERILLTAKIAGVSGEETESEVGLFLLDPKAKGVTLTPQLSTTREPWYEVVLDEALIDAVDVVMLKNGAAAAQWIMHRTVTAYCAMQVGIVDAMTKTTAQFTCERTQFDVPIGSFQAVQHRAADCFIDAQCLKLVAYQAASMLSSGKEATNEVLMAKIWAGDAGHRVSYAAQHLHGGTGIDKDYHLWRFCLWARQIEIVLGSSAQLLSVLGKRIAEGKAFAV